jgi:DNA polymerase
LADLLDALALLRLQIEWGADEALDEQPHDRLAARLPGPPLAGPTPRAVETISMIKPADTGSPAPRPAILSRPPARGQAQLAEELAAAAGDLDALRRAVMGFTGCSLRDTASHTLFAEGDAASGLMLIGEVPDADEDRAGHCFAGPSGALLDRMLASIGLSRDRLLISPLIPWRPPGDRKVNPVELAACLPFLHRLVALIRPARLVLMGVRPTRALLASEMPLSRLRGHWMPAAVPGLPAPVPALPMRHPGHLLTSPLSRRDAWHDLLLLHDTLAAESSQLREGVAEQPQ